MSSSTRKLKLRRQIGGDCCCCAQPCCKPQGQPPKQVEERPQKGIDKFDRIVEEKINYCTSKDMNMNQKQELPDCTKKPGKTKVDANSLGSPIGVISLNQPQKPNVANQDMIRFAAYLKSYPTAFLSPRSDWTPDMLDKLLREGSLLFGDSQNLENPNGVIRGDVYSENEQKVSRHFKTDGWEFKLELEPPFELLVPKRRPNIIANLRPILKAFFEKASFGLFAVNNWYLFIWRDRGVFFVLDFNGRTADEMKTAPDGGLPMLLVLKTTDNVAYLIRTLSGLNPTDKFTIREPVMTRLVNPTGNSIERDYGTRMSQYDVLTADYAYLKSNLHLTLNPKDPLRNRSALPVAVASALASKIDHPATWDERTYDKVMCYGVNMCKNCWEPCVDLSQPVDLDTFPRQIRMGQFVAEILLTPNVFEGYWRCVPNYKDNDFEHELEKALNTGDYVLFQINNQMYSIWKKTDFIYLMDPYRHHIVGRILEEGDDPKSASVRMFGTFDRFLSVFHQILLESNRSAIFHIHTLKIRNITECPPGTAPPLLPPDEDIEVVSLNETINFEENYDKCLDELAQISDYEEDLASEIEPLIEISSSEEMVEEEEEGAGYGGGAGEGIEDED